MKKAELDFGECEISIGTLDKKGKTVHWLCVHEKKRIRSRSELKKWLKKLRHNMTLASLDKTIGKR